ncbi:DUF302 domain-containing protein [Lysobacter silvisoli]|uniref:DUF302 domain-containing protein n=1 Tax=Lysobacter silvisoli TaxID=2293254 RepID=A0A371JYT0_9GAMM|nr:DUF302 domain-containing protein [Lysobacter silvisoli]RDZ26750.1 DUF302 domain-containing protein [Lysobacter silvisoli]
MKQTVSYFAAPTGMTVLRSHYSVSLTLDRLAALAEPRGLHVYARIDHARLAGERGLYMPPTQLLLLGNPLSSTVAMLERPSLAIDVPMKALAWRDQEGGTRLGTLDLDWLIQRHGLDGPVRDMGLAMSETLRSLVQAAASPDVTVHERSAAPPARRTG